MAELGELRVGVRCLLCFAGCFTVRAPRGRDDGLYLDPSPRPCECVQDAKVIMGDFMFILCHQDGAIVWRFIQVIGPNVPKMIPCGPIDSRGGGDVVVLLQ